MLLLWLRVVAVVVALPKVGTALDDSCVVFSPPSDVAAAVFLLLPSDWFPGQSHWQLGHSDWLIGNSVPTSSGMVVVVTSSWSWVVVIVVLGSSVVVVVSRY